MKRKLTLTVDNQIVEDFRKLTGSSISTFVEEKMTKYVEEMRLQWRIKCHECKKMTHIRVLFSLDGLCQHEDCKAKIAEKIESEHR